MDTVQSIPIPQAIHWQSCPQDPLAWIAWRELLLKLLLSPALLFHLVGVLSFAVAWRFRLPPWSSLVSAMF
jgi:hypothetical protein